MTTFMEHDAVHQLELLPLGEGAWRLCDRSLDDGDPASIVAYLEEAEDGIDVVWLRARTGRETFSELEDVLRVAAAVLAPGFGSRSRRPVEIPHIAPKLPPG